MYKNRGPGPDCHRWGPQGANEAVLDYLLDSREGKEDPVVTKEKFEGSHTYLWLLEAGSCAPRGFDEIVKVFEEEERKGLTGFMNALLNLDRDSFDLDIFKE